jgi:predicted acylesterase/phospholipase RssA/CRP-like cAMP-binding protein
MPNFTPPTLDQLVDFLLPTELFRDAERKVVLKLARELEVIFLPSQDTLVEEGDHGDEMFIIYWGRLRVFQKRDGEEKFIGELGARDSVGEIALLIDQPRMATVKAIRDTVLIKLTKKTYQKFADKFPQAALNIAKGALTRVLSREKKEKSGKKIAAITLVPMSTSPCSEIFTHQLLVALEKYGSVKLVTADAIREKFQDNIDNLLLWLSDLEMQFKYVIYLAEYGFSSLMEIFIRQSDVVYLINDRYTTEESKRDIEKNILENKTILQRTSLLILQETQHKSFEPLYEWISEHKLDDYHHVALDRPSDLARMARFITGRSMGLVLAGGGALGFAHVGVFRALEEANISADIIGGTSAGGLIGGLYAMGHSPQEIEGICDALIHQATKLNMTFPYVSIASGASLVWALKRMYGQKKIEELTKRYFCVSTNITSGELCVHDSGLLWESVRASTSLPGIYPPVYFKNNLFVDGAILNNLPVDIMFQRFGAGQVLAVMFTGKKRELSTDFEATELSGWSILKNKMSPFSQKVKTPRVDTILLRSFGLAEQKEQIRQSKRADFCISLELGDFALLDFKKYKEIIEQGYRQAKIALEKWNP